MQTYKRTFVFTNIMRKNRGIGNGLASGSREWRHADGELFKKKKQLIYRTLAFNCLRNRKHQVKK